MEGQKRTYWKNHECISYCDYCWKNCVKHLNLNPLSIAKYFWKKGIDDYALTQDFLYLTYVEGLWQGILLFEERFLAYGEGPVLESVYQEMHNHYKKYGNLDKLIAKTEDINDKVVKACLTKVYHDYQNSKKRDQEVDFIFQVQDKTWESIREKLDNGKKVSNLMEGKKVFLSLNDRIDV